MKKLLCLVFTLLLLLTGCGNEIAETTAPTITEPIPETTALSNEENQLLLEQEAQLLEDKYGVVILVGDQCETVFSHFTASYT
ncbi:MAG: hypothetical protein IJA71_03675, partial [Clostridia bacterium]|nr:hypothetical protein [Clostridia bacterium]